MSCRNCGGNRDCSRCNRGCNNEPDTIVDREILRDDFGFGVTVDGDYTADPDDRIIHVLAAAGTTPVPTITLADPDDVGQFAKIEIVTLLTAVTVANLNGDGTGSATVAAGTGSVFYAIGAVDPCTDTGAVWVPQAISTPIVG